MSSDEVKAERLKSSVKSVLLENTNEEIENLETNLEEISDNLIPFGKDTEGEALYIT
jgi:hypothetical protein